MVGSFGGGEKKVLGNVWALVELLMANIPVPVVVSVILSVGIQVLEKSVSSPLMYLLVVFAFSNHFDQCFFLESSTQWLNFHAAASCSAWAG